MAEIEHTETARVRRAPKVAVFLVLGAAIGVFIAMILTFTFGAVGGDISATGVTYSPSTIFGFLAIICGTLGLLIGGVIAIILDRRSSRRSRTVTIERDEFLAEPDETDD
jgi:hypothetical protein